MDSTNFHLNEENALHTYDGFVGIPAFDHYPIYIL
jgi:hypothetical protein